MKALAFGLGFGAGAFLCALIVGETLTWAIRDRL